LNIIILKPKIIIWMSYLAGNENISKTSEILFKEKFKTKSEGSYNQKSVTQQDKQSIENYKTPKTKTLKYLLTGIYIPLNR